MNMYSVFSEWTPSFSSNHKFKTLNSLFCCFSRLLVRLYLQRPLFRTFSIFCFTFSRTSSVALSPIPFCFVSFSRYYLCVVIFRCGQFDRFCCALLNSKGRSRKIVVGLAKKVSTSKIMFCLYSIDHSTYKMYKKRQNLSIALCNSHISFICTESNIRANKHAMWNTQFNFKCDPKFNCCWWFWAIGPFDRSIYKIGSWSMWNGTQQWKSFSQNHAKENNVLRFLPSSYDVLVLHNSILHHCVRMCTGKYGKISSGLMWNLRLANLMNGTNHKIFKTENKSALNLSNWAQNARKKESKKQKDYIIIKFLLTLYYHSSTQLALNWALGTSAIELICRKHD